MTPPRGRAAGRLREGRAERWTTAGGGASLDGRSIFEVGSITKAFTGVLLADMSLAGEVGLDDPLSRHLPGARPAWRHREPTLLDLATHRSGLPNVPGPLGRRELAYALGLGDRDPWASVTADDYAALVAAEAPRRPPGGAVRYSSMGVGLLGDALAARAGTPYEDLLRERVLGPLGLTDTAVAVGPERRDRLLTGHSRGGRPRPPIEDLMPAAGSLRSTVGDMLAFLAACLRPPGERPGPALALAQQPRARIAKHLEVGLCWMILTRRGRRPVVWHNGGTWGFRSFAGLVPGHGRAVTILSNTARGVDRAGFRLLEA